MIHSSINSNSNSTKGYIASPSSKSIQLDIPTGMEIDLENSDFNTGKITLKKKHLNYDEIISALHSRKEGLPYPHHFNYYSKDECSKAGIARMVAISDLLNVAEYLNDRWTYNPNKGDGFYITIEGNASNPKLVVMSNAVQPCGCSIVYFKDHYAAEEAIQVLGDITIFCALGMDMDKYYDSMNNSYFTQV